MASKWTAADIPSLDGRIAIVTGANSGIGYETAAELAAHGATVVMACRNPEKAGRAADELRKRNLKGRLDVMQLDVSDLDSVQSFAAAFRERYNRLDILCNNAGIMGGPQITRTKHGFETMFGANHLGHFALTAQLLDCLKATAGSRVVVVTSMAHRNIKGLNLDDPNFEVTDYRLFDAYAKSKLANLTFCLELDRRLKAAGLDIRAVAAHPGYTATNITSGANPEGSRLKAFFVKLGDTLIAMPPPKGALPTLYAATVADIKGGEYIGPDGPFQFAGSPKPVKFKASAADPVAARRLWETSETLTGQSFLS